MALLADSDPILSVETKGVAKGKISTSAVNPVLTLFAIPLATYPWVVEFNPAAKLTARARLPILLAVVKGDENGNDATFEYAASRGEAVLAPPAI